VLADWSGFARTSGFENYKVSGFANYSCPVLLAPRQSRMVVRPLRNTSLISISIYADQPEEAARIANEIVQTYKDRDNLGPFQVEVVDRAMPALRPIRPNKPFNLALGVLLGLVLGTGAGAARVARHARKTLN